MEQNNSTPEDEDVEVKDVEVKDVGWITATPNGSNNNDVRCTLCGKVTKAGIHRHKIHIAGIKGKGVKPCPKASEEQKRICREALKENENRRIEKLLRDSKLRDEVLLSVHAREKEEDEICIIEGESRKRNLGPMDNFSRPIHVDDESASASKKMRQSNVKDVLDKKRTHEVHEYLARWMYENGISFNSIDNDSFKLFVEALGRYGPDYTPPSQYQLREPLLKGEVGRTKEIVKKQEEEWKSNGCSIMTDAWSDGKRRSIINLCVNCKLGTTFISSKYTKEDSHTGQYIFEYVDECVKEVGEENVVQIVTDNASNNMAAANLLSLKRPKIFWISCMAAANLLSLKRPKIFWISCATHTLNLMLEAISKLPTFKGVIKMAKSFTIFVYAHHKSLALMRKFTKKEIVRPGATRFASSFLTLQSLLEKKQELRNMMTSNEWDNTKLSKTKKGKEAFNIVVPNEFWNLVELCLRVFTPLVKVLRLVDGEEKPSMGFIYGELLRAKEDIVKTLKKESDYIPILNIIDSRGKDRLDSPLHTTSYLLNPFYFFKNSSIKDDPLITSNFITCVEKFFHVQQMQHRVINIELPKYIKKEGAFGRKLAITGCESDDYDPVSWWDFYGNETPNLKYMAKRILGLTTSSSGCERNWSVFEGIHTKKRNRLDATRMRNLVYVQFNARLMNKKKRKEKLEALLATDVSNAQSWIVENCDDDVDDGIRDDMSQGTRDARNLQDEIRDPEEEDFESDGVEDELYEDN